MKIGILTFFESDNYGTVLQAYALQDYIESLGHQAILIHLKRNINATSSHFKPASRTYTLAQRIWNRVVMQKTSKLAVKKKAGFQKFRDGYLNITPVCYESGEAFLKDASQYDLLISGGDQIWNPYHKVFSLQYMLDFLPENYKRVSYGSSFGVDKIEDQKILENMKNALKNYKALAVRETSGIEIIKEMGLQVEQVVDPVFLRPERWKTFVQKDSPMKRKYGLVYALIDYSDECDKEIKNYAKENQLELVILPDNRRNCMNRYQKKFGLSPIEFLNYIAHSEIVFTNSFHGLAFAILFKKKVVILEPLSNEAKSKQNRLFNLIDVLGMGSCDFRAIKEPIDYETVDRTLNEKIEKSRSYLLQIMEGK